MLRRCFIDIAKPYGNDLILSSIYIPLWSCWLVTLIFYLLALYSLNVQIQPSANVQVSTSRTIKIQQKLIFIPLVFILLRVFGSVHRVLFMFTGEKVFALAVAQSIGDPGQGFVNGILYVMLTKKVRDNYVLFFRKLLCCSQTDTEEEKSSLTGGF